MNMQCFSPLSGDCLFLTHEILKKKSPPMGRFQSPQRGLFISYKKLFSVLAILVARFSPLSGDCLFLTYEAKKGIDYYEYSFQSPQRGLFISYVALFVALIVALIVSVPSAGIVYFLHESGPQDQTGRGQGFSPLSGDCLFLTSRNGAPSGLEPVYCFSPLSGDCLFLTNPAKVERSIQRYGFQSPQRGLFISY